MSETNINEINNYNSPNQQGGVGNTLNVTYNISGDNSKPLPKFLTATLPEGTDLIGRDDDLATLGCLLESKDRVVLVNGIGGVGKTELCKRFFRSHFDSKRFKHFAWINYYSSLKESFALQFELPGISDRQDISMDDRFKAIISCLRSLGKEFLLVVDNMDSIKDDDLKELKQLTNKVIVTSRIKLNGLEPYHLGLLPLEQCIELFYNHYNGSKDDEHLIKIIELAGRHTLTVELLAKTADSSATELEKFYSQLVEVGFNLNEVIQEKVSTEYNEHNDATFFNHLLKVFELSGITEQEIYILTNLSILPAMYIEMNSIKEWLVLDTKNELNSLIRKGWMEKKGFNAYMHPVIAEVVRYKTKPNFSKCCELIEVMCKKITPQLLDNPFNKKMFIPHLESILKYLNENRYEIAILLDRLSYVYKLVGNIKPALSILIKSHVIKEHIWGINHPELSPSWNNLASLHLDLGNYEKALEFQLKSYNLRKKVINEAHPDFAVTYINLATIYQSMGELKLAYKFQSKAINIQEKILDKMHPALALSYSNLSTIHYAMGELDKALNVQLKALSIKEHILEKTHPELAESYNILSVIYQQKDELEKALDFQLKALSLKENILGKEHPKLASSYSNLSMIYKELKIFKKALEFQLKAHSITEKTLGKEHPNLATSLNNLALINLDMGKANDALNFQLKAYTIMNKHFNNKHPDLAVCYNNLSMIYRELKYLKKALDYQLKGLKIMENILNDQHHSLASCYHNLATIYAELKDFNLATLYEKKAVVIQEKIFPNGHLKLKISKNNLKVFKKSTEKEQTQ